MGYHQHRFETIIWARSYSKRDKSINFETTELFRNCILKFWHFQSKKVVEGLIFFAPQILQSCLPNISIIFFTFEICKYHLEKTKNIISYDIYGIHLFQEEKWGKHQNFFNMIGNLFLIQNDKISTIMIEECNCQRQKIR